MIAPAVQTSAQAHEPDLFGDAPLPAGADLDAFHLRVEGVLLEAAEVVTRHGPDGVDVPVISMDLRPLSGADLKVHAELVFSKPEFGKAQTKAGTLHKGACVAITTPLKGIRRDCLPDVRSVALLPSPKAHP
ncbi:hypothetical protein [Variovorax sp. EBFNA2]|uniref:hypothetical protein n=1 Tax=Variovorax sp. EBFNA2 TaxID=3342097 RepID=UPI0029C04DC4|nr:hypothetical protein [Variovorax boronicumulans]WPG35160.1 hypothetical protein RZE79_16845 [Variovorax boronicumulans]